MFNEVKRWDGSRELTGRDNKCLLVSSADSTFTFLNPKRGCAQTVSFLPIQGATITLDSPTHDPIFDTGNGLEESVELTGQNIVTCFCDGTAWYVAGLVPKKRPVGRPRRETVEA